MVVYLIHDPVGGVRSVWPGASEDSSPGHTDRTPPTGSWFREQWDAPGDLIVRGGKALDFLARKSDTDAGWYGMAELAESFRADKNEATLLVLFIPSADREGDALGKKEQKRWVHKALKLLGETLGGATAFPRGWGVWSGTGRF